MAHRGYSRVLRGSVRHLKDTLNEFDAIDPILARWEIDL